jgi:hypothetical protein
MRSGQAEAVLPCFDGLAIAMQALGKAIAQFDAIEAAN